MAVVYQLSALTSGIDERQTIYDIIEAAFQNLEQVITGHTRAVASHIKIIAELALQYSVREACFLFLAQLERPLRWPTTPGVLIPWCPTASFDSASWRVTPLTFEEKLFTYAATLTANRVYVSCHFCFVFILRDNNFRFRRSFLISRVQLCINSDLITLLRVPSLPTRHRCRSLHCAL